MVVQRLIPYFAGFALLAALLLGSNATQACTSHDVHSACGSHAHSPATGTHQHTSSTQDHDDASHRGHCTHLHCCICEGCHSQPKPPVAIAPDNATRNDLQLALTATAVGPLLPDFAEQPAPLWARPPPSRCCALQLQHLRTVVLLT